MGVWSNLKQTFQGVGRNFSNAFSWLGGQIDAFTGKAGVDAQKQFNAEQMAFQRDMYGRQRADALADWNMQNEYNSPAASMARFRSAGLNPALIYGAATGGSSGVVRSSTPSSFAGAPAAAPQGSGMLSLLPFFGNLVSSVLKLANTKAATDLNKSKTDLADLLFEKNDFEMDIRRRLGSSWYADWESMKRTALDNAQGVLLDKNKREWEKQSLIIQDLVNRVALSHDQSGLIQSKTAYQKLLNDAAEYDKELRDDLNITPTNAKYIDLMINFIRLWMLRKH